jgi:hypothetical protein
MSNLNQVVRWPNHPGHPTLPASAAGWLRGGEWVVIQGLSRPDLTISVLLDEEGARITRAGGIWEQIPRPRDVGVVEYNGRELLTQDLAIILDGFALSSRYGERWMDRYINILEELADRGAPVRLLGPVYHAERKWVIESIDFGTTIGQITSGRRLRQHLILHLLEYVVAEYFEKLPKGAAQPRSFRWYVVVWGDDLGRIATKTLGRLARWPEIQELNPGMRGVKLDPTRYPPGTRIKVPK